MVKKLFLALLVLVALFGITTLEQWFLMTPTARAQANTFCAANLACTVTGIWTFSGNGTAFKYLNNVRFADQFAGADCGAKVNAADADLGATFGEIWVNQTCGTTWTTAVSISAGHVLRFVQGGTYTTNTLTFANWSALVGSPGSVQFVASQANTILRQANGTNGNPYIHGNGSNILFRDIAIDGNGSNNATGGADIDCLGSRCQFQSVSAINSPSHGLRLGDGTCCQNRGSGAKISNSHFVGNTGSGILLNFTTDVWVMQTELDNNSRYGLEGLGIATARIIGNDVGGNTLGGVLISGTAAFQSGGSIITANEFKNNLGIDLDIESDTGAPHANGAVISANSFQGLGGAAAANTFPAIRSNGGGANSIVGNFVQTVAPSYKYCINIAEPGAGQELADEVVGNQCTGSFGTSPITVLANTSYTSNFLAGTANQSDSIRLGTGGLLPQAAGGTDVGRVDLPFGNIWLGTAATNNLKFQPAAMAAARVLSIPDPLGAVTMPYVIASGTSTLTSNAALAAVTSQAAITTAATNTLTTDSIEWSYATAPTAGDSLCHVSPYVTAGNVNFVRTNPTAAAQNVSALIINWRVIR